MKKGRHSRGSMHWRSQRSWKMVLEAEEVVILEEDAGIRGFLKAKQFPLMTNSMCHHGGGWPR